MTRRLISTGSPFEHESAYSRAVVDGDWIFVAGTTGFDYATMTIADDVAAQTEQIFSTIEATLSDAGASIADIVRARYILPDRDDWPACRPVLRRWLGDVRPASTMIVAGLADPRMKIEIEVTAHKRSAV